MQVSAASSPYMYNSSLASINSNSNSSQEEQKVVGLNEQEDKQQSNSTNETKTGENSKDSANTQELTPEEEQQVSKLQARDTEVRAHEAAHIAAAGGLAVGGASFSYQRGPDGIQYAIGGEVAIDTSPGKTPEETIIKMQKVRASATAPANPSAQDMRVASTAAMIEMKARMELSQQNSEEANEKASQVYSSNQDETSNSNESEPLDLSA